MTMSHAPNCNFVSGYEHFHGESTLLLDLILNILLEEAFPLSFLKNRKQFIYSCTKRFIYEMEITVYL